VEIGYRLRKAAWERLRYRWVKALIIKGFQVGTQRVVALLWLQMWLRFEYWKSWFETRE